MIRLLIIILCAVLSGCAFEANNKSDPSPRVRVVGVVDGDTVKVLTADNTQLRVRLYGIDAPESRQPYGQAAKQHLSGLIFGRDVGLTITGVDLYGRSIGIIILDGTDINLEMIRAGMAWCYRRYCDNPKYIEAEKTAKATKIGLWREPDPVPPWQWRKKKRTSIGRPFLLLVTVFQPRWRFSPAFSLLPWASWYARANSFLAPRMRCRITLPAQAFSSLCF